MLKVLHVFYNIFILCDIIQAQMLKCMIKCNNQIHTACLRGGFCGPEEHCRQLKATKMFRKWITDAHNVFRNQIAGGYSKTGNVKVSNMRALSYDLELEHVAQCWANFCKNEHDKCRITKDFSYVGQNLYVGEPVQTEKQILKMMDLWTSKNDTEFVFNSTDKFPKDATDDKTTHFAQIIWAETSRLGCGRSILPKGNHIIVCNYGTGGNTPNKPVFLRGMPCSKCPEHLKCHHPYTNLCGKVALMGLASKFYFEMEIYCGSLLFVLLNYMVNL